MSLLAKALAFVEYVEASVRRSETPREAYLVGVGESETPPTFSPGKRGTSELMRPNATGSYRWLVFSVPHPEK